MYAPPYRLVFNGDQGLTILFDRPANESLTRYILSLAEVVKTQFDTQWQQVIPAYQSLTIAFDPLDCELESVSQKIERILNSPVKISKGKGRLIKIPVCYHIDLAPDLADLAVRCELTIDQVIRLHSKTDYQVNMLGFLPGFLYLSGLNTRLHCPRKAMPALRVEAGAVGIGGDQTGVYPVSSPGGWRIIGRTPLPIFTPNSPSPFIAKPLDKIRFMPIGKNEFEKLSRDTQHDADS